jgi:soluble lytic murein transglycosylase
MATVPSYGGFQVQQTTGPDADFSAPTTNPGAIGADQLKQLGEGAVRAGGAGANIALDQMDLANQVKVNDAMNRARAAAQSLTYDPQTGYTNLKGDAALTRPGGVSLPDEYGSKLQESISDISGTLGNEMQRRAFQLQSSGLTTQFQGDVQRHMLGEFREFALSTQDGTINLASDTAKRGWNNPDAIFGTVNEDGTKNPGALDAAKAAVYQKGKLLGWSAAQTDAALLATTSHIHTSVVMSALENNNPNYALGWLDRNKDSMTADDILRVQGQVNQSVWANAALGAVQKATTDLQPRIAPTGFDRMTQITAQTESGSKDFNPDGSVVTSPKGAQGSMQVMPATAANPGFGIKPADLSGTPQQQAAERARVGTQYLQALVQKYGDPAKAWAAYNAGPGAVDAALKQADTDLKTGAFRGGQPGPDYWLTLLPKETQDYVTKNVAALGSTESAPPRPTEMEFVNAAMSNLPPGAAPQLVQRTREQATQQFGIITKSLNEQGQNALGQAQRWLAANNGDLNNLPVPLRAAVTQYAPGDMFNLTRYARTIARGENVSNDALYNRLAAHPDELANLTDVQYESLRPQLSKADFDHFAIERGNLINGKADQSSQSINTPALNQSLNSRLESLGLPVRPDFRNPGSDDNVQLGSIRKYVRDSIFAAQAQTGKKMSPEEIDNHLDGLFMKSTTLKNLIMPNETKPLLSIRIGDLSGSDKDGIKAQLAKEGNLAPTDSDVIRRYWAVKSGG